MKQRHLSEILTRSKVDYEGRCIYGAALITAGEAKGHTDAKGRKVYIDETTLKQILEQCKAEGNLKLKIEHNSGVVSTAGYVTNFQMIDSKVVGDLCFYESETATPRLLEIAENNPHHIGISLEFDGKDVTFGNKSLARCSKLYAAAIVSDPAANDSLFEEKKDIDIKKQQPIHIPMTPEEQEQMNELTSKYASLEESINSIMKRFEDADAKEEPKEEVKLEEETTDDKIQPEPAEPAEPAEEDEAEEAKKEMAALRAAVKQLTAKIGTLPAKASPHAQSKDIAKKDFSQLVSEATTKLGCPQKAMIHCIKNHRAEYAAWRPVNK